MYDVRRHDGTTYLVSELLGGSTLRDRLHEARPWPLHRALDVTTQIAKGLSAAHAKGIVHRDLKPENAFVTTDGSVKVLAFGLAKLRADGDSREGGASTGTQPGAVMGSLHYMAPEQLRAQVVDHRADTFALGGMLYEMLAGLRAFDGATPADTQTAILSTEPPDLAAFNGAVPRDVDRLMRRCLAKLPDERFQSTRDLGFALEGALSSDSGRVTMPLAHRGGNGPDSLATTSRRPRASLWLIAAAVAVLAAVTAVSVTRSIARAPAESAARVPVR